MPAYRFPVPSCSFLLRLRALGLGIPLLFAPLGCQPELLHEDEGGTVSSRNQPLRIANSLTTQALVLNAIATNSKANQQVGSNGLAGLFAPVTADPYLQLQLRDVDAQHFMEYLVSCALGANRSISWRDPLTNNTVRSWTGQAGLCPQWETMPPTEECKRRVSACILARNNAYGRRVELSLRGEDPVAPARFALEPNTPTVVHDPDLGMDVPSFQGCATPQSGMQRNCGWAPGRIGQCAPGRTVRLGAGGVAPDQCGTGAVLGSASGSRMMLRVCAGIIGCDGSGSRFLTQSQGTCGTSQPAVSFTCPASGYFNVMAAPYSSWLSGTVNVGVETGTPAKTTYARSEGEVFRYREGAFYGTLFAPSSLGAHVFVSESGHITGKNQIVPGAVYQKMFSCYAPEWLHGMAYATHRVCALSKSEANCAATVTGPCVDPSEPSFPASMCLVEDGPLISGDGDFGQCHDPSETVWMEPITVYLHGPCNLLPSSSELCAWSSSQK